MPDRPLFDLAPGWRLTTDDVQWIVQNFRPPRWRSVAFVATTKVVLERILREQGVVLTPEARRALDRLPETFREWRRRKIGR